MYFNYRIKIYILQQKSNNLKINLSIYFRRIKKKIERVLPLTNKLDI